jgi:cytochrome c551/c552
VNTKLLPFAHWGRPSRAAWALSCCVLLASLSLPAAEVKIELPHETAAFKPGPGSEIANGQCLICHSVEYVMTQPPLPRSFWLAEVKKMRDKFGAPIPEAQIEPLVSYLTKNYGMASNEDAGAAAADVSTAPLTSNASASASGGEAIATRYGCLGCHGASVKIVGPAYKDVAAKYSQDAQAPEKISQQIHKGGSGKWGPIIMPPFPMVTAAETKALTEWILSRK